MTPRDQLENVIDALGARMVGAELLFPCPACQAQERDPGRWKGRLAPGYSQLILVCCRRNCKLLDILAAKSLREGDIYCPLNSEEIKATWDSLDLLPGEVEQVYPLADADTRHAVYSDLLAACPAEPPYHTLPADTATKNKIASDLYRKHGDALYGVPGFALVDAAPVLAGGDTLHGLLIPVRDLAGRIIAMKVRRKKGTKNKIRVLSSAQHGGPKGPVEVHVPLGVNDAAKATKKVRIVEGERKADTCWAMTSVPTVSIPGTGTWRRALPVLEQLGVETVILSCDMDAAGLRCDLELLQELSTIEAVKTVVVERWDSKHKGLDDLLAAGGQPEWMQPDEAAAWLQQQLTAVANTPTTAPASRFTHVVGATADVLLERTFPDPRWAIKGLLPEGLSVIAGKAKSRKSWMMLDAALSIASGGKVFGDREVEQGDVLYLALEDSPRRLQGRLKRLLESQPVDAAAMSRLHLRWMSSGWPRWDEKCEEALTEWLDAHPGARLVIIDTLAKIRPTKAMDLARTHAQDEKIAERLAEIANERQIAIVLVHHVRKAPTEDPWDAILGSSAFQGIFDCMMLLTQTAGMGVLRVKGRDVDEEDFAITWDDATMRWTIGEQTIPADQPTKETAADWLLRVLADASVEVNDLKAMAKEAGHGWRTCEAAKSALGNVEAYRQGKVYYWRLAQLQKKTKEERIAEIDAEMDKLLSAESPDQTFERLAELKHQKDAIENEPE
jgi:RecA-family ATPase